MITVRAEWQVFMPGRDGHMPCDRIVRHWVRLRGRCCSGACYFPQRGKICQPALEAITSLRPSRSKPWAQWTCQLSQLFANLGRKISSTSGDDREGAFLFQSFGAGATLQHCLVTWQRASSRLHELMICTQLCIILIFKLPPDHIYRGLKKIIILNL